MSDDPSADWPDDFEWDDSLPPAAPERQHLTAVERQDRLHEMFDRITAVSPVKITASHVTASLNLHQALLAMESGSDWQQRAEDRFTATFRFIDIDDDATE